MSRDQDRDYRRVSDTKKWIKDFADSDEKMTRDNSMPYPSPRNEYNNTSVAQEY